MFSNIAKERSLKARQLTEADSFFAVSSEYDKMASSKIMNSIPRERTPQVREFNSDFYSKGNRSGYTYPMSTPIVRSVSALPPPNFSDKDTLLEQRSEIKNDVIGRSTEILDLNTPIPGSAVEKQKVINTEQNAVEATDQKDVTIKAT